MSYTLEQFDRDLVEIYMKSYRGNLDEIPTPREGRFGLPLHYLEFKALRVAIPTIMSDCANPNLEVEICSYLVSRGQDILNLNSTPLDVCQTSAVAGNYAGARVSLHALREIASGMHERYMARNPELESETPEGKYRPNPFLVVRDYCLREQRW